MVFYNPNLWYVNSAGYSALPKRIASFSYVAGEIVRQGIDPTVNNERAFICGFAGTTDVAVDATWVLTRGALTNDGTVRWYECTGQAALCGDKASTKSWAQAKAIGSQSSIGAIIKRNNEASYQICTTAGSFGASEPAFSDVAGVTTVDGATTWVSLGPVANYPKCKAPFPRLASAFATNWGTEGDTFYVGSDHTEIQPSQLLQPILSPKLCMILCHDVAGSYPPIDTDLRTTAVISSSQSISNSFKIVPRSPLYIYGINFRAAVGGVLGSSVFSIAVTPMGWIGVFIHMENCTLEMAEALDGYFELGFPNNSSGGLWLEMNNVTFKFKNVIQYIQPAGIQWMWKNTSGPIVGPVFPNTLLKAPTNGSHHQIIWEGLDLGNFAKVIFAQQSNGGIGALTVKDCALNSLATFTRPLCTGYKVRLINSDSGDGRLRTSTITWEGTEDNSTVFRTGTVVGPSEFIQSRMVVTTANVRWERPFVCQPIVKWNDQINVARTVTVYLEIESAVVPKNDEVWLEVDYLGSSSHPLSTNLTTTKATFLSAATAGLADGSTWSNAAIGRTPIMLTATFTPRMAGTVTFTVKVALPNTTIWIDPIVILV